MHISRIVEMQRNFFSHNETKDVKKRIEKLKKLYSCIKEMEEEISYSLQYDLAKTYAESYITEISIVLSEIKKYIKNIKKWSKPKKVRVPLTLIPANAYKEYQPYGNTLVISPWNYPFQLAMVPLASSIMCGNTVVLKPSFDETPNVAKVLEKIVKKVFKDEWCYVYNEPISKIDDLMKIKFDYIFFTGSSNVGKTIMKKAANDLTPVTLELGGKSPVIIDENVDISLVSKRIAFGKMINAGQTCVAPDYVLIKKEYKKEFIENYIKSIEYFYSKNPATSPEYPKIVNEKNFNRLKKLIKNENASFIGEDNGLKMAPSILVTDFNSKIMEEEIFGPILPIIEYTNLHDLIDILKTKEKPLALYIFSNNKSRIDLIKRNLDFGGLTINDTIMHFLVSDLGFGGIGFSGMGKYHGYDSFLTFSYSRGIVNRRNYLDLDLRYPPYNEKKLSKLRKIL